jgi:hypothetical protein
MTDKKYHGWLEVGDTFLMSGGITIVVVDMTHDFDIGNHHLLTIVHVRDNKPTKKHISLDTLREWLDDNEYERVEVKRD